jgi:hypothetical protein
MTIINNVNDAVRIIYLEPEYWNLPGFHEAMSEYEILLLANSIVNAGVAQGKKQKYKPLVRELAYRHYLR